VEGFVAVGVARMPLFWPTTFWEGRGTGGLTGEPGFVIVFPVGRPASAGLTKETVAQKSARDDARKVFMEERAAEKQKGFPS
jgi:hypothetical protein